MNEQETRQKIQEIANKIAKEFQPEKIILFGSYAWGKPGPDSDVDLFIVKETEDTVGTERKIDHYLWRREFPLDILVYSPKRIEPSIKAGNFFIRDIIMKGQTLYAK